MESSGRNGGWKILLLDDDPRALTVYGMLAGEEGYGAVKASTVAEARRILEGDERLGLAVVDLKLPDGDGLDLFRWIRRRVPGLPVIILTGYGSIESAVQAVKDGAYHYLEKPPEPEQVRALMRSAVRRRALEEENARLRQRLRSVDGEGEFIGRSRAMLDVFQWLKVVGPSQSAVLIGGESGTGKELAARALHRLSPRRDGPFVSVNCGALPPSLLESELFGHEKGAFTGAASSKTGMFELADGGTIFLDEVGECSADLQVRLLRVLQDKEVRRVGGTRSIRSDFRLMAATNRKLEAEVEAGRFREDLYYRINVIGITMPPLRERGEDIPLLASFFAERFALREGRPVEGISGEALAVLAAHRWPGNVRELENAVERGVVVCRGGRIEAEDLPPSLRRGGNGPHGVDFAAGDRRIDEAERVMIAATLEKHGGNKSRAARVLGISRKLLYSKLREYGL